MRSLSEPIRRGKRLRVIGIDDSPFQKGVDPNVNLSGIICSGTRFEGMLWREVERDGCDPETASLALDRLTDTGDVLESLRLAHLIGAAVKLGASTKRA